MPQTARKSQPLTEEVIQRLRAQLGSGAFSEGRYLPSERELCRELDVSRFTVRRALDRLVQEGVVSREPSRGYVVKSPAGETESGTRTGVVFLHSLSEEKLLGSYHARIWAGARKEAERGGGRLLISSAEGEEPSRAKAEEVRTIADGVLCDLDDERWIEEMIAVGLQVVRVDHMATGPGARRLDTVIQDDFGGIGAAVEHLVARGHRRIGYLHYGRAFPENRRGNASRRLGAFLAEGRRLGLDLDPGLVAELGEGEAESAEPAAGLLAAGATALIVPHDFLLPGARAALEAAGIALRGDCGLVVWGEPTGVNEEYPSHVTWSKEAMGREAVRRLRLRVSCPEAPPATVTIPAEVIDCGTGGRGFARGELA